MTNLDTIRNLVVREYERSYATQDEFLNEYMYNLYQVNDTVYEGPSNFLIHFLKTAIFLTGYTDMYLLSNHKAKELRNNLDDYYIESYIDDIEEYDDLLSSISADPSFLKKMLESILEYNRLPFLAKKSLNYNLSKTDVEYLKRISPFFEEEYLLYTAEVQLEDYMKYFSEKVKLLEEENISILEESIVVELVGFMKNLSKFDYTNFMENLKDLLIYYYSWSKFDVDHKKQLIEVEDEEKQIFIDEFENTTFSEIGELVLNDEDFLVYLLSFYIATKPTDKLYSEKGESISYKEVEAYVDSIEEEKVKEKLKYKH